MNKKNIIEDIILDNNDEIEIVYNEDFSSEKTKSLTKFPTKITKNNEFHIDSLKNFSKSLNFNFRQCFAPKIKSKKSSKNPTPIFKKIKKSSDMDNKEQIITEDCLSEKESSINNDSFYASDLENNNEENYNQINNLLENEVLNVNNNEKNNNETKSNINNINNKNIKSYEHKTISFLQGKMTSNKNSKDMKKARMDLSKIKFEALGKIYKETEYKIKENNKNKYNLDLVQNSEKFKYNNNEYTIIKINDIEEEKEKDMSKFRTTISFNKSKFNKFNKEVHKNAENDENDYKGFTIYDILINKKKINK